MTTSKKRKASQNLKLTGRLLDPVLPNSAVRQKYEKALDKLVEEMHESIMYWVRAEYKKTGLAQDALSSPAKLMQRAIKSLTRRWLKRFDGVADKLASQFINASQKSSDVGFHNAMKKAGFTVEFSMSEEVKNALEGSLAENVGLIKSIAEKHLSSVETIVMQSVSRGFDMQYLADNLQEQYGVTKRRAAFIARDQSAKANAVIVTARQKSIGITHAIWRHSGGGRVPRPSHLKAGRDRLMFDLSKGAFIDGEYIFPGQLINCRCSQQAVMPWEMTQK